MPRLPAPFQRFNQPFGSHAVTVVDFAQGDDMHIETCDFVDQGLESSRDNRGITPNIKLKNP